MTKQISERLFAKALTLISRASFEIAPVLYASGAGDDSGNEITPELRDELLKKLAAGEYVAIDVDTLAYEQRPGVANRNYVRFRDGALVALGASAKGKPFLRDHMQWNSLAGAGKILTSKTTKLAEGHYEIRTRVRLTADWAVKLALQGLLYAVSIGWEATGPIECSVCQANIRRNGWACHWPGERLTEVPQADGSKKYIWDRNGVLVVEWIYTAAEIIEESMCPIGGVKLAGFEGVRAALSAGGQLTDEEFAVFETLANNSTPADPMPQPALNSEPIIMNEPVKPGIVILSPAQYALYQKLSPADQDAFVAKASADRDAQVAAALAADAPIWKGELSGVEVRASDGALALQLAKQNEDSAKRQRDTENTLATERAARELEQLRTRAKTELAGMAGSDDVHVAILRAIDGIADEKVRTDAKTALAAWKVAATSGGNKLTPPGANPGQDAPAATKATALAALEKGLLAFCKEKSIAMPWVEGLAAFKATPEGKSLADAYDAAK